MPLHKEGMAHLAKQGVVVYLDVAHSDILKRMKEMKVSDWHVNGEVAIHSFEFGVFCFLLKRITP